MVKLLNKLFGKKEELKKARAKEPAQIVAPKREETAISAKGGSAFGGKIAVKKEENAQTKAESKILLPHITEKASLMNSLGRYVFRVPALANKIDVAREVLKVYKVKAVSVNLINIPGKERRVGRTVGFRPGYKKAIVKLAKGQTIEIK